MGATLIVPGFTVISNFKLHGNLLDSGDILSYSQGNRGPSSLTGAREARWKAGPDGCLLRDPPWSYDGAALTIVP